MDDDRVVGALERAHALTLEYSMLADAPEMSWQTNVLPALQVPPVCCRTALVVCRSNPASGSHNTSHTQCCRGASPRYPTAAHILH